MARADKTHTLSAKRSGRGLLPGFDSSLSPLRGRDRIGKTTNAGEKTQEKQKIMMAVLFTRSQLLDQWRPLCFLSHR